MGLNSPLDYFDLEYDTGDYGVWVSALWSIASYITVPVEFIGNSDTPNVEHWRIINTNTVPEPSTAFLFAAGLAGLALINRRIS